MNDDDVFALAGLTDNTTGWHPITRTVDFDTQQKLTRQRLAETYEPGRSERSMISGTNVTPTQADIDALWAACQKIMVAATDVIDCVVTWVNAFDFDWSASTIDFNQDAWEKLMDRQPSDPRARALETKRRHAEEKHQASMRRQRQSKHWVR